MHWFDLAVAVGLALIAGSLAIARDGTPAAPIGDKNLSPDSLVGRYQIISGEKNGVEEPAERIKGTTVTWRKESVIVADKDTKELYSASYKLDTTTNPSMISLTSRVKEAAGEVVQGLISKEGDTVRLIYALPTGEAPTSFKTKQKQLMFVMKRAE